MRAIKTRYVGCSNTRPARLVVESGAIRIVVSYPIDARDEESAHRSVAEKLCRDMKWDEPLITGCLGTGEYVHVFNAESSAMSKAAPAMYEALLNLVISPAFNGPLFEKDKESHKAWTLARQALAQAEGR